MLAFLPNQLRRSTRSLRGSATTSSKKTEKFSGEPFCKGPSLHDLPVVGHRCATACDFRLGGLHHSVRAGMCSSGGRTLSKTRISRARGLLGRRPRFGRKESGAATIV